MELRNIIVGVFAAIGFILTVTTSRIDILGILFLIIGFFVIFLLRFAHFLLMQFNRLTERSHQMLNIATMCFCIVVILGSVFSKFQFQIVLLPIPFGNYFLFSILAVTCFVLTLSFVQQKFEPSLNKGLKA